MLLVGARPAAPDRALFAALAEPLDPASGIPGLGLSVTVPRAGIMYAYWTQLIRAVV
jgi:hypothetical protein